MMVTHETLFSTGEAVTLQAILTAKEAKIASLQFYLKENQESVIIALRCNIPGAIKNNAAIGRLHAIGRARLATILARANIAIVQKEYFDLPTGPESMYVVTGVPVEELKVLTIQFEEMSVGRLFDADVYYLANEQVCSYSRTHLRGPLRSCLVCGAPAKSCSGRRIHPLAAVQAKIVEIVNVEGKELL